MTAYLVKRIDRIVQMFDRKIERGWDEGEDSDQIREWAEERAIFVTYYTLAIHGFVNAEGLAWLEKPVSIIEDIYKLSK